MEALRKRTSPGVPPRLSKEQSGTIVPGSGDPARITGDPIDD
jgi:hypothetical protein